MSAVDPLDLSNLQLIPDWVKQPQEKPKFKEESVRPEGGRGFGKGGKQGGRGGAPHGRRDDNRGGSGGGNNRPKSGPPRGDQPRGQGRGDKRPGGRDRQGDPRRDNNRDRRPAPEALPKDISLTFQPARDGVAFIADSQRSEAAANDVNCVRFLGHWRDVGQGAPPCKAANAAL